MMTDEEKIEMLEPLVALKYVTRDRIDDIFNAYREIVNKTTPLCGHCPASVRLAFNALKGNYAIIKDRIEKNKEKE